MIFFFWVGFEVVVKWEQKFFKVEKEIFLERERKRERKRMKMLAFG